MNKLVSRDPIQRFKEGKKIVKALKGDNTSTWNPVSYGGYNLKTGVESALNQTYQPKPKKSNSVSDSKNQKQKNTKKSDLITNLENSQSNNQNIVKDATNMIISNLRNQTNNNQTTNGYGFPKQGVNEYGFPTNNTRIVTADNHYIGTKGNVGLYRRSALRAGVTNRNQVAALQRKLGLTADGVWGANTQAAWEKANGLAFTPTENISLELPTVTANNLAGVSGNTSVIQPTKVEPVIQPRNYFNYTLPNYDLIAQNRLKQSGIRTYLKQGGKPKFFQI